MKSCLSILVLSFLLSLAHAPSVSAQYIGRNAQDLVLPDQNGEYHRLSDFAGHYIYLNFWASWCPTCDIQFPNLIVLQNKYQNTEFVDAHGFKIFGVSVDRSVAEWKQVLAKYEINWPECNDLTGYDSPAALAYSIDQVPTSLLINPQGIIVAYNPTFQEVDKWLQKKQVVQDALVYRINLGEYHKVNDPHFNQLADLGMVTENKSFGNPTALLGAFANIQAAQNVVSEVIRRGYVGAHIIVERGGHLSSLEGKTYAVYEDQIHNIPPHSSSTITPPQNISNYHTPAPKVNNNNINYNTGSNSYRNSTDHPAVTSHTNQNNMDYSNNSSARWRTNKNNPTYRLDEETKPNQTTTQDTNYGVGTATYIKPKKQHTLTTTTTNHPSNEKRNKSKKKKVKRSNKRIRANKQPSSTTTTQTKEENRNAYSKQTTTTNGNAVKHNITVERYVANNKTAPNTNTPATTNANGIVNNPKPTYPYAAPNTPYPKQSPSNYKNKYASGNNNGYAPPVAGKQNYNTPPPPSGDNNRVKETPTSPYNPYMPKKSGQTGSNTSGNAYNPYANKTPETYQQGYNPYNNNKPATYSSQHNKTPAYQSATSREEYKNPYSSNSSNSSNNNTAQKVGNRSSSSTTTGNYNPYVGQKNSSYSPVSNHVPTEKVPDYNGNYNPSTFQNAGKSIYDIDEDWNVAGSKRKKRKWRRLRKKQQRYKKKLEQMNEQDQLIEERKLYDNIYGK